MQSKVSLEGQFSYNIVGFILFIILLVSLVAYFLYVLFKHKPTPKNNIITKDILIIKKKYLYQIDSLYNEINSNKIKSRTAYNRLSVLIRSFV